MAKTNAQVEDVTGPSASIQIRPQPKQAGARLSQRGRNIGVGIATMVVTGMVVGIMMAGHHGNEAANDDSAEQVGTAQPPSPPPPAPLPLNMTAPASSLPEAEGKGGPLAGVGGGQPSPLNQRAASQKLTPAQKYHQWLASEHYKILEARILAQQSAYTAPISKGSMTDAAGGGQGPVGMALPGARSGHGAETDPQSYLDAALRAARGTTPIDVGAAKGTPQGANQQFMEEQKKAMDKNGYLAQALQKPISRHELFAGSVIPAVLITGINSDLPGEITAQVRQNVYNSLNPVQVLIPQGARLVGEYSSQVAYGQSRVLVAWNRIIFPNGETIALQGMPGTGGTGEAGFHDLVDDHYWRIFGSAILISMLGVGAQLSQPQNSNALTSPSAGQQAASAAAAELNNVGTQLLQKNLNVQPTLKIRPGYLFNVLVTRTMIMPPYSQAAQ